MNNICKKCWQQDRGCGGKDFEGKYCFHQRVPDYFTIDEYFMKDFSTIDELKEFWPIGNWIKFEDFYGIKFLKQPDNEWDKSSPYYMVEARTDEMKDSKYGRMIGFIFYDFENGEFEFENVVIKE